MTQIVDMSVVSELVDLAGDGDPELLLDLIGMFLDDAPMKLNEILQGARDGDLEAVERAAHSLKGSSGNLGAVLLMQTAEELQLASRAGEVERVQSLLAPLQENSDAALEALVQLRADYTP